MDHNILEHIKILNIPLWDYQGSNFGNNSNPIHNINFANLYGIIILNNYSYIIVQNQTFFYFVPKTEK